MIQTQPKQRSRNPKQTSNGTTNGNAKTGRRRRRRRPRRQLQRYRGSPLGQGDFPYRSSNVVAVAQAVRSDIDQLVTQVISGREFMGTLIMKDPGVHVMAYYLNPSTFPGRMPLVAAVYKNFVYESLSIVYVPTTGTINSGKIHFGIQQSGDDTTVTPASLNPSPGGFMTQIYAAAHSEVDITRIQRWKLFDTAPATDGSSNAPVLWVYMDPTSTPGIPYGDIYIEFKIKFSNPSRQPLTSKTSIVTLAEAARSDAAATHYVLGATGATDPTDEGVEKLLMQYSRNIKGRGLLNLGRKVLGIGAQIIQTIGPDRIARFAAKGLEFFVNRFGSRDDLNGISEEDAEHVMCLRLEAVDAYQEVNGAPSGPQLPELIIKIGEQFPVIDFKQFSSATPTIADPYFMGGIYVAYNASNAQGTNAVLEVADVIGNPPKIYISKGNCVVFKTTSLFTLAVLPGVTVWLARLSYDSTQHVVIRNVDQTFSVPGGQFPLAITMTPGDPIQETTVENFFSMHSVTMAPRGATRIYMADTNFLLSYEPWQLGKIFPDETGIVPAPTGGYYVILNEGSVAIPGYKARFSIFTNLPNPLTQVTTFPGPSGPTWSATELIDSNVNCLAIPVSPYTPV